MKCKIAGIHFEFNGLGADQFSTSFPPFLCSDSDIFSEPYCRVEVAGADESLCGVKSERAWSVESSAGGIVLSGAAPEGELLWRMSGAYPFEELCFVWNPETYFKTYCDPRRGYFMIIPVLAMVLRLLQLRGFVLHSSAAVIDGAGVICAGRSGRGKSTISKILEQTGIAVLTDERPVVRVTNDGFRVYGTPWPSSGGCVINADAPLSKLYFIEHGVSNRVQPLSAGETLKRLIDVAMIPWMSSALFDPLIEVLENLVAAIPSAVMSFVPDKNVVDFIRTDLNSVWQGG